MGCATALIYGNFAYDFHHRFIHLPSDIIITEGESITFACSSLDVVKVLFNVVSIYTREQPFHHTNTDAIDSIGGCLLSTLLYTSS